MNPRELAIIFELIDSSSDDEDAVFYDYLQYMENKRHWEMRFTLKALRMSNEEFKRKFRISRTVANNLIQQFGSSQFYNMSTSHGGIRPVSAETHILVFLWYATNRCILLDVAELFGISVSSVLRILRRVSEFLNHIASDYMYFPLMEEEKIIAARSFCKMAGFPGCLGCIGTLSIKIRTPSGLVKNNLDPQQRKMTFITLQAIVTSNNKFANVWIDEATSTGDLLEKSKVQDLLSAEYHDLYHIVGSAVYPLRPWLLTPYSMTPDVKSAKYNKAIWITLGCVPQTFSKLKSRFSQLLSLEFHSINKCRDFIISCCVLHNMCTDEDQIDMESVLPEPDVAPTSSQVESDPKGLEKRESIAKALSFQR